MTLPSLAAVSKDMLDSIKSFFLHSHLTSAFVFISGERAIEICEKGKRDDDLYINGSRFVPHQPELK